MTKNWVIVVNLPKQMPVSTEINDLFFSLEEATTGAELLEVIEAYVDGNAGN